MDVSKTFWYLDSFSGADCIPLRGVNMPFIDRGGLETELLMAYGFPTKGQPEHSCFIDIVKRATKEWNIPNNKDGNPWWTKNETAKMDKFIYAAFREGFITSEKMPVPPIKDPAVINHIRRAMV